MIQVGNRRNTDRLIHVGGTDKYRWVTRRSLGFVFYATRSGIQPNTPVVSNLIPPPLFYPSGIQPNSPLVSNRISLLV